MVNKIHRIDGLRHSGMTSEHCQTIMIRVLNTIFVSRLQELARQVDPVRAQQLKTVHGESST